jgi:hypothetical protein
MEILYTKLFSFYFVAIHSHLFELVLTNMLMPTSTNTSSSSSTYYCRSTDLHHAHLAGDPRIELGRWLMLMMTYIFHMSTCPTGSMALLIS